MPRIFFIVIIGILCGLSLGASAQISDEQLAEEYFNQGEFAKAELYYEKLYGQIPSSFHFSRYYESLLGQDKYDAAEKLIKRFIRKNPQDLTLRIELGQLYNRLGENEKAEKEFQAVIKGLDGNQGYIITIARKFVQAGENEYALQTYEKGRKLIRGFYSFNYEVAELYGQMKQYDQMVALYLEMIETNPGYLQTIQNALNRNFDFEDPGESTEALRKGLLEKVQKNPDEYVFSEMLIWLYLQQKDFYGAFAQTKALDKRKNESGKRLLALGQLYKNNEDYKLAEMCFDAVIKYGKKAPYYHEGYRQKLSTQKIQLEENYTATVTDWQPLAEEYKQYIAEEGITYATEAVVREYAEVLALRLGHLDESIALLDELLATPRLPETAIALAKIDLGDYYLMKNEVWEAALLYGQAEKMFKYDPIGEIAKFKYGKIGYYTGDFDWAKAQLDVLKGSTSKLIANDAMYISLLITDNTTIDTTYVPMEMFARADLYTEQKRYAEAIATLDSINIKYPGHSLEDDILYLRYKIYFKQAQFEKAAEALQQISEQYSDDILGDEALYYLGVLYEDQLHDKEKAKASFQQLLVDFPGSVFVAEARKRFRELRGDQLN